MTRKEAILQAISLLDSENDNGRIIVKLKEILNEMPFVKWTEAMIRDCIEQFMLDNQRLPLATDLHREKKMPVHTIFKYVFEIPAMEWIAQNYPSYYFPDVTWSIALQKARDVLVSEEAKSKIENIEEEYPFTKWNEKNIVDGLETFFEVHGYLPRKEDYRKEKYLPFIDIYKYRYNLRRNAWIELHCPELMRKERARGRTYKQSSLSDFAKEYERIKPFTVDEFNQKRSKQICCAEVIMRHHKIKSWGELLERCQLKRYVKEVEPIKFINNVVAIIV